MESVINHVLELATVYGLPVLWCGLFVAGLGLPIPEDVFLITGGVITHRGQGSVLFTFAVLYSGVMVGDSIVYYLGSHYGEAVLKRRFIARLMTPARVERVKGYYAKYGALTVFLARHVAGIRFPTFLLAGVSRIGFGKFFFWDGLAAFISVPLWIWIGYAASENWKAIHDRISGWVAWVLAGVIAAIVIWKAWPHLRKRMAKPTPTDATASLSHDKPAP